MRLVFLGTPSPATRILEALVSAGHDVALVVSRADKRRGRGNELSPSSVKRRAMELGLPVTHNLDAARSVDAELGVVVAYGRMIPPQVLNELPMINVHFSLLPRWRGAAPVERALLAGDVETGVCIMRLVDALDEGPVYARAVTSIAPRETSTELLARLTEIGAKLVADTLARPLGEPRRQEGASTYAAKLEPLEFELDWSRPAAVLDRLVRVGRAWTTFRGNRLRILEAVPLEAVPVETATDSDAEAYGVLRGDVVRCAIGGLLLLRVQPAGKAAMAATDWMNGAHPEPGEQLGR